MTDLNFLCQVLSNQSRTAAGVAIGPASAYDEIAREAINHPKLGTSDLAQAPSIYISIRSGPSTLRLSTTKVVIDTIRSQASGATLFVYDSCVERSLGTKMEIFIVADGLPVND